MEGSNVVFTIPEIAKILRISRGKAYELAKQPGFPTIKMGKSLRVPREAFNKWVNKVN